MAEKTAIAIARVSTAGQAAADKVSHDEQLRLIAEWGEENGYSIVQGLKETLSGATDLDAEDKELRPIFWGAWDELKAGRVDAVIFWEPTRFCRDAKHDGLKFAYWFRESRKYGDGIRLTVGEPPRDGDQAAIMTFLQGYAAAQELKAITRRSKTAHAAYFAQGKKAQGKDPFGYRWDKDALLFRAFEPEAKVVRTIFGLYASGLSMELIAEELREKGIQSPAAMRGYKNGRDYWDPTAIQRILKSEMHVNGYTQVTYQDKTYSLPSETLIDRPLFEAVRLAIQDRQHFKRRPGTQGLFQGRLTCGLCGRSYYRGTWWDSEEKRNAPYYYCRGRTRRVTRVKGEERCESIVLPTALVDEMLWEKLVTTIIDKGEMRAGADAYLAGLEAMIAALAPDIAQVEVKIRAKQDERARRVEAWVKFSGDPAQHEENIARLDKETAKLQQYLAQHGDDVARMRDLQAKADSIRAATQSGLVFINAIDDLGERKVRVHLDLAAYFNEYGEPEVLTPTNERVIEVDFAGAPPAQGQGDEPGHMENWRGSFVISKDALLELLQTKVTIGAGAIQVSGIVNFQLILGALGIRPEMAMRWERLVLFRSAVRDGPRAERLPNRMP